MVCTKCGRELVADARFCSNCGEAAAPRGINVRQDVGTVSGTVTGLTAGQSGLPDVDVRTDQTIDTVAAGGTVAGIVLGGAGETNVGGQHVHGDLIQGDKMGGDIITVGDIIGKSGFAIGRGASAIVQTLPGSDGVDPTEELQQSLAQIRTLLQQLPASQATEAEAVATLATQAVDLARSPEPNRTIVQITVQGLLHSAQSLAAVLPIAHKIADLVTKQVS